LTDEPILSEEEKEAGYAHTAGISKSVNVSRSIRQSYPKPGN